MESEMSEMRRYQDRWSIDDILLVRRIGLLQVGDFNFPCCRKFSGKQGCIRSVPIWTGPDQEDVEPQKNRAVLN